MEALLEVSDLVKRFPVPKGLAFWRPSAEVRAVDGVSFSIEEGRRLDWSANRVAVRQRYRE